MALLVLDLFSGTGSSTKGFTELGHRVISVERNHRFTSDLQEDILFLDVEDILEATGGEYPDFIWASPPCTSFSVASMWVHWTFHATCYYCREPLTKVRGEWLHDHTQLKGLTDTCKWANAIGITYEPKSARGREGILNLRATLDLIHALNPKFWVIENPRGLMRKMPELADVPVRTVTYCQYGDFRQKPTDLFGYLPDTFEPKACEAGAPCHEAAPNGSKTGSQALDKVTSAMIPLELSRAVAASVVGHLAPTI